MKMTLEPGYCIINYRGTQFSSKVPAQTSSRLICLKLFGNSAIGNDLLSIRSQLSKDTCIYTTRLLILAHTLPFKSSSLNKRLKSKSLWDRGIEQNGELIPFHPRFKGVEETETRKDGHRIISVIQLSKVDFLELVLCAMCKVVAL